MSNAIVYAGEGATALRGMVDLLGRGLSVDLPDAYIDSAYSPNYQPFASYPGGVEATKGCIP